MAPKKASQRKAEVDELQATIQEMAKKVDTIDSLEGRIQALESQCQEEGERLTKYFDMVVRMSQIVGQSVHCAMKWGERSAMLQAEVRKMEEREKQGASRKDAKRSVSRDVRGLADDPRLSGTTETPEPRKNRSERSGTA